MSKEYLIDVCKLFNFSLSLPFKKFNEYANGSAIDSALKQIDGR